MPACLSIYVCVHVRLQPMHVPVRASFSRTCDVFCRPKHVFSDNESGGSASEGCHVARLLSPSIRPCVAV